MSAIVSASISRRISPTLSSGLISAPDPPMRVCTQPGLNRTQATPRGLACVLLSPGWVKTRMGGGGAEITAEESVGDMRALIERLTLDDTGRFLRRNGSELPW